MKSSLGDRQRIQHIREAIDHIENFTDGIDFESYMNNFQLRLALVKLLEIVGEAAAALSEDLKQEFSEIEWITLKAVRNILVHEYFGISYDIIWTSIQKDIPPLKEKIESLIAIKFSDGIE
ncbi:HepT-like ribonuclease domain-containing protein [Larkinella sp. GY13]|uniref:HepT-like ribonuclease domain-containing protein n=1 Tax=Larkinella sp. GY13 TaxID=3453720 RepID=UPI003EEB7751